MVRFSCIGALGLFLASSLQADDITPRVGIVQVFGAQKVSAQKIQSSLSLKAGDPLPGRDEAAARLAKVSGVVDSSMQAVCCAGHNMVLYIGIEERSAPHLNFHATPAGTATLPAELFDKYDSIVVATEASLRGKNADEDLTNGYSLLADPEGRQLQQDAIASVAANLTLIDQVVRQSADRDQRAAAAYLLQYAPRSPREVPTMINALQYALQDPDELVRQNAMIALKAVLVGARLHHDQHIHVEPTWFVELMNSLVWSDRRNASLALVTLTDSRNPDTLNLIRDRALHSVEDMAQWQDLEHALPGFLLAGRIAGWSDKEIQAAWVAGDRESLLKTLRKQK